MKKFAMIAVALSFPIVLTFAASEVGCHTPAPSPAVVQKDVEAGTQVADGVCQLIDGFDDSGIARTVCANLDEIGDAISFILTLRKASDAAALTMNTNCSVITGPGGKALCATKQELAKSVLFIVQRRNARLSKDASSQ